MSFPEWKVYPAAIYTVLAPVSVMAHEPSSLILFMIGSASFSYFEAHVLQRERHHGFAVTPVSAMPTTSVDR